MIILRQFVALILITWIPAFSVAQNRTIVKGNFKAKGSLALGAPLVIGAGNVFAQLPRVWVNSGLTTGTGFCSPPGGTYDAIKTMKTSGGDYTPTISQLIQVKTDQVAANQWWLLRIDAGLNIHGSSYDANNALMTWPSSGSVTKCLVVQSSTHNTDGQIVCAHGLPGFGGTRDPNCATDGSKFWKFTVDSTPTNGFTGMLCPAQRGASGSLPATALCSYLLVEDMELSMTPGAFQSKSGVKVDVLAEFSGDHVGLAYSWVHGYDPGDAGQPGIGSGNAAVDNATGACLTWNKTGTVNTSGTSVTWVSGDQFGMDFADATHSSGWSQVTAGQANQLVINGVGYTISSHDPVVSGSTLTIGASAGTQTAVTYTLQNPATAYATGCGDDSRGIEMSCTNCFIGYSQLNKIHWSNNESHAISGGFSAGPMKYFQLWVEPGSSGIFFGGGPLDTRGGPVQDVEVGNVFIGRNLGWRFLSAASGQSPAPPFGCGPIDGVSAHDTCSFNWAIKNNLEMKECNRCVLYGIIFDGVWADGQSGYAFLMTPRAASGGSTAGIYDPTTGLPLIQVTNVRVQDFWFRNCPQAVQISTRSGAPGDGGGISKPIQNVDFINGIFSNCGDGSQWGQPGDDLYRWGADGQIFFGSFSRTAGVAHAVVAPMKIANYNSGANVGTFKNAWDVASVTSVSNVVTISMGSGQRHDPTIGGQVTIANVPGWNGTFTVTGALNSGVTTVCSKDNEGNTVAAGVASQPQPCIRADGTFGESFTYTDTINSPGTATLCTSSSGTSPVSCQSTIGGIVVQSIVDTLAYKISDITIGDGVYVHDCTGGSLGNPALFEVGATSFTPAITPTNPAGNDVYYVNAFSNDSGVTCQIENKPGFPARTSIQNVTVLSPTHMAVSGKGFSAQSYQNFFLHNVFATTDASSTANITCADAGNEGTAAFACWDLTTYQFFDNVLQGRSSGLWSVVPGGSPVNFFPSTTTCSGATATSACLGYTGYMSGTAFPTAVCSYNGTDPTSCPLMTAPWSSNFDLSKIVPVASSSYQAEGVQLTNFNATFNGTKYICPVGAVCGSGPFDD